MINCVYILTFANNKRYVGISSNPKKRISHHAKSKQAVGHAWRKYGKPDIQIAFSGSVNECKTREVKLIKNLNTRAPFGYNLTRGGDGQMGREPWNKGQSPSEETKAKLSAANKGRVSNRKGIKHTEETKTKMSVVKRGKKFSTEHRRKLSEAHQGKRRGPQSLEHRRKLSEVMKISMGHRKGVPLSIETKAKISVARRRTA